MSAASRHEEFERVLRTMRERLDAVSDVIAKALTKANWQAEKAPMSMRISARAAAAEIAHTQEWLHERLSRLPLDPQQRYLVMQELLQAQFVALQKVTSIVEDLMMLRDLPATAEYLPPGARSQPQVLPPLGQTYAQEQPFARDFSPPPGPQPLQPSAYWPPPAAAPAWDVPPQQFHRPGQPAPLRLADLDPGREPVAAQSARPQTRSRTGRTAPPKDAGREKRRGMPASTRRLAIRSAVLLVAILSTLGAGYFAYSRVVGGAHKTAAKSPAGKAERRVAIGDPAARQNAGTGAGLSPVRSLEGGTGRVPSAPPMSSPPLDNGAPGPDAQPNGAAPLMPGLVLVDPGVPRANARAAGAEQFVPVIATHRDRAALLAILGDLKRQFPTVLGMRQSEAQPVNLGDKGVWHHLVLLPPGTRQQAMGACEELRAVGYMRCSVRPY